MAWETVVRDDKLGLRLVTVQMTCLLHINENKSATEMIALLTQAHTNLEIEQTKMHCPVWEEGFIFFIYFFLVLSIFAVVDDAYIWKNEQ